MIDPAKTCLFIPAGLKRFKLDLFERIGAKIQLAGGSIVRHDAQRLLLLPNDVIPIVGCQPETTALNVAWRANGRRWIYWDRGYLKRVFATHLPRAESIEKSYYRFHVGSFQMLETRKVADDRWKALKFDGVVRPWERKGRHIVIAAPTRTYSRFHRCEGWIADTIDALSRVTSRQLVIRDKESKRSLQEDLEGAHCLVTHASIAAVESVVLGCPVFVHPDSAAALVGHADIKKIETPVYPDRQPWLNALAYSQWSESELTDGTLWRMLS